MLTKQQKVELVKEKVGAVKNSRSLIFAGFDKVTVADLSVLRKTLKETGARFQIVKKRLLKIILQQSGVAYDPTESSGQIGIIFVPTDVLSVAGKIYQFIKNLTQDKKKNFQVLAGFDRQESKLITADEFLVLAQLPSREVLLTQLAVLLTMPVKKLMFALNGRAEKL